MRRCLVATLTCASVPLLLAFIFLWGPSYGIVDQVWYRYGDPSHQYLISSERGTVWLEASVPFGSLDGDPRQVQGFHLSANTIDPRFADDNTLDQVYRDFYSGDAVGAAHRALGFAIGAWHAPKPVPDNAVTWDSAGGQFPPPPQPPEPHGKSIGIPYWFLAGLSSILPWWAYLAALRRIRRARRGQCLACGYNLTGNTSGVCPECGGPAKCATA